MFYADVGKLQENSMFYADVSKLQGISLFSVVALVATLFITIGQTCFSWLRPLSPTAFYKVKTSVLLLIINFVTVEKHLLL